MSHQWIEKFGMRRRCQRCLARQWRSCAGAAWQPRKVDLQPCPYDTPTEKLETQVPKDDGGIPMPIDFSTLEAKELFENEVRKLMLPPFSMTRDQAEMLVAVLLWDGPTEGDKPMTDTTTDPEFREVDEPAPQVVSQVATLGDPFDAKDAIRQSRMLIPVKDAVATPLNFAQQIDFAQSMAKALYSLPAHLQGNVGDCLAIVDLASRAGGLSPYMVASLTYLDPSSKRLALMSQLYHALVAQSGLLIGDFEVTYEGEGGNQTCIVAGKLRSDGKVRTHTSPPLREVHPGYSLKRGHGDGSTGKKRISYDAGQAMKAGGELAEGEQLFSAGSPLWDRKPLVQLFYDTSRDWVRIFAPTAALGMVSQGDFDHHSPPVGPDNAKDVTGLAQRLASAPRTGEGYRDGHADSELSKIAPAGGKIEEPDPPPPADGTPGQGGAGAAGSPAKAGGKEGAGGKRASEAPKAAAKASPKRHRVPSTPPSKAAVQAAADRAENPPPKEPPKPAAPKTAKEVKSAADYLLYARAWIDESESHHAACDRYDNERDLREKFKVPIKDRNALQSAIDHKFEA